ncbi:MAG: hypothetical protein AB7K37_08280 [Cyclobacteriaceae bacterium]
MNEAAARKQIIDRNLLKAGWSIADPTHVIVEFDIYVGLPDGVNEPETKYQGHQYADYVLLGKDGKPLAVVEAKKTSKDAEVGREQAKQYCVNIQQVKGVEEFVWELESEGVLACRKFIEGR